MKVDIFLINKKQFITGFKIQTPNSTQNKNSKSKAKPKTQNFKP